MQTKPVKKYPILLLLCLLLVCIVSAQPPRQEQPIVLTTGDTATVPHAPEGLPG